MFGILYLIGSLFGAGYENLRRAKATQEGKDKAIERLCRGENKTNTYYDWQGTQHDLTTGKKVMTYREHGHLYVKEIGGPVLRDITQEEINADLEKQKRNGEKVVRFNAYQYLRVKYKWADDISIQASREARSTGFYIYLPTMRYCIEESIDFSRVLDDKVHGRISYYVDVKTHKILDIITTKSGYPFRYKEGEKIINGGTDDQKILITDEEEKIGREKFFELGLDKRWWAKLDTIAKELPEVAIQV